MHKTIIALMALTILGASIFGAPSRGIAQATAAQYSVEASVTPSAVTASSPAKLIVTLRNNTAQTLEIWDCNVGRAEQNYVIGLYDEQGARPPEKDYLRALNGDRTADSRIAIVMDPGYISIPAGGKVVETAELNELFDLSRAGRYRIQVQRKDPDVQAPISSNVVTFTVENR